MAQSNEENLIFEVTKGGVNEKRRLTIGKYKSQRAGCCALTGHSIVEGDEVVELETAVNLVDGSETMLLSVIALDLIESVRGAARMGRVMENAIPIEEMYPHLFEDLNIDISKTQND